MIMRVTSLIIVIMFLSVSLFAEEQKLLDGTVKVDDKEFSETTDQDLCDENDSEEECEVVEEDALEYEDTTIVITV